MNFYMFLISYIFGDTQNIYKNKDINRKMKFPVQSFSLLIIAFFLSGTGLQGQQIQENSAFCFVFATDLHIRNNSLSQTAFRQAADSINALKPDFVIMGGDQIWDALAKRYRPSRKLFKIYLKNKQAINAPVYEVIGNHDLFGMYKKSGVSRLHPLRGPRMFRRMVQNDFFSFYHKGVRFILLNSICFREDNTYFGCIDKRQIRKIKRILKDTDPETPIILASHIPFSTKRSDKKNNTDSTVVVSNESEVLALFESYNLKAVLQGHVHYAEDYEKDGVRYITGGAISGKWWKGRFRETEEGFMYICVQANSLSVRYIDYGWDAKAD